MTSSLELKAMESRLQVLTLDLLKLKTKELSRLLARNCGILAPSTAFYAFLHSVHEQLRQPDQLPNADIKKMVKELEHEIERQRNIAEQQARELRAVENRIHHESEVRRIYENNVQNLTEHFQHTARSDSKYMSAAPRARQEVSL